MAFVSSLCVTTTGKNIFNVEKTNSVQPEVESAKMCYYPMVGKKKKKDVWSRKSLKRTNLQSM